NVARFGAVPQVPNLHAVRSGGQIVDHKAAERVGGRGGDRVAVAYDPHLAAGQRRAGRAVSHRTAHVAIVSQTSAACGGWARQPVVRARHRKRDRPTHGDGCGEEVAEGAVRRMNAGTAVGGVGLDVRHRVGFRGVETGVRPGRGPRQRELQEGRREPERPQRWGTLAHAPHAGARISFRRATAPTKTIPYMHTISGPVGRSPASESQRPSTEASAPEPHEMYASRFMSRVNMKAMTAGTTRKLNTMRTPATGTANVINTPNDR